ncbi:HDIG domain-containing metalloprotein [Pectinatus cerevisiiphilus]|uniref:Putative nucleotidyltransferase with HDIG domain n=1 Tax=Pectinatus cerevisiiphilus TaxID=86956 RepID=A0A4R3KBM2_9FIRM|nr:HDIG domain-containing metalloprotein [Pectinatus cerevisiiphilus]TCS80467.1 putative nucleotidyltransferase with HDIG domain [Pectinatus cerevisiiphilus]
MIQRIVQFFRALNATLSAEDNAFIAEYLHDKELALFTQMNVYDKRHAVRTAYTAVNLAQHIEVDRQLLIRAALLHDIGRSAAGVCLIDKILFVLLSSLSGRMTVYIAQNGRGGIIGRRRNALYICMHHAAIGAEKLEKIDEQVVAQLVKRHHDKPKKNDSQELVLLRQADEIN